MPIIAAAPALIVDSPTTVTTSATVIPVVTSVTDPSPVPTATPAPTTPVNTSPIDTSAWDAFVASAKKVVDWSVDSDDEDEDEEEDDEERDWLVAPVRILRRNLDTIMEEVEEEELSIPSLSPCQSSASSISEHDDSGSEVINFFDFDFDEHMSPSKGDETLEVAEILAIMGEGIDSAEMSEDQHRLPHKGDATLEVADILATMGEDIDREVADILATMGGGIDSAGMTETEVDLRGFLERFNTCDVEISELPSPDRWSHLHHPIPRRFNSVPAWAC